MKKWRIQPRVCLAVLFSLTISFSGASFAQNTQASHRLIIDSVPRGALVEISGRYSFIGKTPFVVPYKLVGDYKIAAHKDGYENVNANVRLVARGANQITLRLSPKTALKASFRSLFLPGWGQFYGQGVGKGLTVSLTQAGLLLATYFVHDTYLNQKNQFEASLAEYERVRSDFERASPQFLITQKEFKEADEAHNVRNVMLWVSAGFWFYNFLDSIIFFSDGRPKTDKRIRLTPYFTRGDRTNKFMISLNVGL